MGMIMRGWLRRKDANWCLLLKDKNGIADLGDTCMMHEVSAGLGKGDS
jgi:hypothetical protein